MSASRQPSNATTREGAEALAHKLDHYWHAQGHTQVQHWVESQRLLTPRASRAGEEIWVVRSNLVNGMPPRSTPAKAGSFSPRSR